MLELVSPQKHLKSWLLDRRVFSRYWPSAKDRGMDQRALGRLLLHPLGHLRRNPRRGHPGDGDLQRAQGSLRRLGQSGKTSGLGDVQQTLRQLLEMRPRPLLRLGQGVQRLQTLLARVGTIQPFVRPKPSKVLFQVVARRVQQHHRCLRQQRHQEEDDGHLGAKPPLGLLSQDARRSSLTNHHLVPLLEGEGPLQDPVQAREIRWNLRAW